MLGYLSLDILYALGKLFASRNRLSADNYPSIFSRQMEAIVYEIVKTTK